MNIYCFIQETINSQYSGFSSPINLFFFLMFIFDRFENTFPDFNLPYNNISDGFLELTDFCELFLL